MSLLAKVTAMFDASSAVKAKEDIDKLKEASPQAASAVSSLESAVQALMNPMVLMAGAVATATGYMVQLGMASIETADNLGKLSIGTGKTTSELEVLGQIADKSGTSLDQLMSGLDFISKGMSKGEEETQRYAKALEFFGVSMRDANGQMKDAETIANEVANAYVNSEKTASTQAAAVVALGSSYKSLIPTYLDLNKQEEEHNFLMSVGAEVTAEQVRVSTEYNDTMSDMHKVMVGVGNYTAQTMLPLLLAFAKQLLESATNGGILEGVITSLKVVFDTLVFAAKSVFAVFIGIDTVFQMAAKSLGGFAAIVERVFSGDWAGAKTVWKEMGNDIDDVAQRAGERINTLFASLKEGAKQTSEETAKINRGDFRSTNEKTVKVKVEKDPVEEANKALEQLIDNLVTANKATETGSELQKMAAKIETERYAAGNQALKDRVLLLAREADALKANKDLEKQVADIRKQGDETVRSLEDEVRKRTMNNAQYRQYVQIRQVDLAVAQKLAEVNENIAGAEERKQQIINEGIKQKDRIRAANEEVIKSDQDWTTGAKQGMNEYLDKISSVANNTKELMTNAFSASEDALVKLVTTGKMDFKGLADSIIADLARMAIRAMMTKAIMAMFGGFSEGGAFDSGSPTPFATGDVVGSPTLFPMANGNVGMMGEAGPEAIMPLTRLPSGRLGVEAAGGGGNSGSTVTVGGIYVSVDGSNTGNTVEDRSKLANEIGNVVSQQIRAAVNSELSNQRRPGNMLNPARFSGVF